MSESESDEEAYFLLLLRFFLRADLVSASDSEPESSELSLERRFLDFFFFFLRSSSSLSLASLSESDSTFLRFFVLLFASFDFDFARLLLPPSSESDSLSSDEAALRRFFLRFAPSSARFRFLLFAVASSLELAPSPSSSVDSHSVAPRAGTYVKRAQQRDTKENRQDAPSRHRRRAQVRAGASRRARR